MKTRRRDPYGPTRWTKTAVAAVDWDQPDRVLAPILGVEKPSSIRHYLRERGYPIPMRSGNGGRPRGVSERLREKYGRLPLGEVADAVVAARLGTSRQAVAYARRVLGIAPKNPKRGVVKE